MAVSNDEADRKAAGEGTSALWLLRFTDNTFYIVVALAFSGVFAMQPPVADADTVVFFDAGGGGGGGGDEAVADAADDGDEQVEEVVEEETITLPDGKIELSRL